MIRKKTKGNSSLRLVVVAHNIRSCYNVGSIFRTADALGVEKIFLTGYTPSPRLDSSKKKIHKTALGAEASVEWAVSKNVGETIERLKKTGFEVVGLEQSSKSQSLFDFNFALGLGKRRISQTKKKEVQLKIALVLGNEVRGISPRLLEKMDQVVEIPMAGKKESLNVSVAFGVAGFWIMNG